MIRLAQKLTETLSCHRFKHAAFVIKGGSIIAMAPNHHRHAEVAALSKLWPSKRKGTTVLSLRVTRSGLLAMAKPCEKCMRFMLTHGVRKIMYSTSEREIEIERY